MCFPSNFYPCFLFIHSSRLIPPIYTFPSVSEDELSLDQNKFLSLLKEIKVFWNILRLWWALTQQTNHICEGHESTYDVENIQLLSISKETLPIQCSYNGVLINLMLSCLRVFKKNKNKKNPSFYKGRIKKACLRNTYVEITVKF